MRCLICNAILTTQEIKNHPITGEIEPCTVCIDASKAEVTIEDEDLPFIIDDDISTLTLLPREEV